jgi:hypothetical protein
MASTPLLIADKAAPPVFHAHFVANEIDFVEPKSGFVDGSGDNGGGPLSRKHKSRAARRAFSSRRRGRRSLQGASQLASLLRSSYPCAAFSFHRLWSEISR